MDDLEAEWAQILEALWAFYARDVLNEIRPGTYEIAWMPDHAYNDFALTDATSDWDPTGAGQGEFLRIEAKSMNLGTDEPKGHFDVLENELSPDDLLLVLVWKWDSMPGQLVFPRVLSHYIGTCRRNCAAPRRPSRGTGWSIRSGGRVR